MISMCHRGDAAVTQDYGVAAMALGKGAYAIHQSGKWYTDENIDQLLMEEQGRFYVLFASWNQESMYFLR